MKLQFQLTRRLLDGHCCTPKWVTLTLANAEANLQRMTADQGIGWNALPVCTVTRGAVRKVHA